MIFTSFPFLLFVLSLIILWASAMVGSRFRHCIDEIRRDFNVILTATLTLLGLVVGFTFSMAVSRYDLRKHYEAEEANAVGTEYVRSALLPAPNAEKVQTLLREYLNQRIMFYKTHNSQRIQQQASTSTAQLQDELWAAVQTYSISQQTPITALVVSGMNDVFNSQGYTQAAWLNRIPIAAWVFLGVISVCANVMVGLSLRHDRPPGLLMAIFPVVVSFSVLFIADIDAPHGGFIHVKPDNLVHLAASFHPAEAGSKAYCQ
jgi:hypothetical protein